MEFKPKSIRSQTPRSGSMRKRLKILDAGDELQRLYPHNLTFYLEPPTQSISLKEFEEYAVARLKLLRVIERVNLTSNKKYSEDWRKEVEIELVKGGLNELLAVARDRLHGVQGEATDSLEELFLCRKYDHISHFILRLAYCRSEELRKWFVAMELDFFRFKFLHTTSTSRDKFLELYNLRFEKVDKETVQELQKELSNSSTKNSKASAADMDYYEVPFHVVLDLVRGRKVFLKGGMAFVPYNEIIVIIATEFRKSLSHCVALTRKAIPEIQEDERLSQILTDFDKRYTGKSYETKKGKENSVTINDLPDKAKNSFPLCMKELYDIVEKEHHLKHFGRLQLGLFLKGIGLSMEEATKFWRSNFTKKAGMDGNRFDKQYLYNIRHMYGKEGKRADYTPYSCMKVIMSSVGTGDYHGCPFRHSDATPLRSRLIAANISNDGVKEIMKLVQEKHYQIACQKYFELRHGNATVGGGIHHPNQYFEESENVNLGLGRKARTKVETITSKVYPAPMSKSVEDEEDPEEEWIAAQNKDVEWLDDDILCQVEEVQATEPTATTIVVEKVDSFLKTIEMEKAESLVITMEVEKIDTVDTNVEVEKVDTTVVNTMEVEKAESLAITMEVEKIDTVDSTVKVEKVDTVVTTMEVEKMDAVVTTMEVDKMDAVVSTMEVGKMDAVVTTMEVEKMDAMVTTMEVEKMDAVVTTMEVEKADTLVLTTTEVETANSLITTMKVEVENATSSTTSMEVERTPRSTTSTEVEKASPSVTSMEVEKATSSVITMNVENTMLSVTAMEVENAVS